MTNPFRNSFRSPAAIEDEAAWAAGRERNIRMNARKGRENRWFAEDESRRELVQQIWAAANDRPSAFMAKMADSLAEWGTLTAGQEAAVRRIFTQNAERAVARKAEDAKSVHLGTVGERREFFAKVFFQTSFDTQFGTTFVTGLKDIDGNILIHKGSSIFPSERGTEVRFTATVKEHGVRDGVNQTIVARPKVAA